MQKKALLLLWVLMSVMVIGAPAAWAKNIGYGYLIAYSAREQVAYYSPILSQLAVGASSSDEEYFVKTSVILDLESAFQKYLEQKHNISSAQYTFSARAAFKSEEIAKKRFDQEIDTFRFRGFQLIEASNFKP
ncbi:hypothetical protein [Desulfatitalea alkaliphila]|uniref:Uncharacterized protein n=1 Tax=Desulfatitalea alkaliphila TaxID=2929485 RepID=A0AA41R7D9_9BACT|nr:hypothetical protein [Desulfatitalea alkaliphila]MCJ8500378.1 hypothetical protein [Desulfatitalea alkaliphila]